MQTQAAAATNAISDIGLAQPARSFAVGSVLAAMTLVVLDSGMTNLALPTISDAFGVPPGRAISVVTAYQTALVMALLPCAALGERFGYRRVFASGVILFVMAQALCAFAPLLSWLITARFIEGLGGAAILALGVPLLRLSVSTERLGAAIGWNALTVALAGSAGPSLGALILSFGSWPWLYAAGLPVGALALVAARSLPATPAGAHRLDFASMALSACMFAALVLGAELAPKHPVAAMASASFGALALVILIRREAPKSAPLIPLDLMRIRGFRLSVLASLACFTGQTAALIALPFYLQHGLGQTPAATGAYLAVWPLAVAGAAVATGKLGERVSTAWLCAIGGGTLAVGLLGLALWPLARDVRPVFIFAVICGAGFGLFQAPNNRNMFLSAPLERSAASGGMQGTARLSGQTLGAVLVAMLFASAPLSLAPRLSLTIGAALATVAAGISLLRSKPQ